MLATCYRFGTLLLMTTLLVSCSDQPAEHSVPAPGVARELAEQRAGMISDLRYVLDMVLPAERNEPVSGTVDISFVLQDTTVPLVLDFRAPAGNVLDVRLDGQPVAYSVPQDHIVIAPDALRPGQLTVSITFNSTDVALNRQDDFLYALFVPDRASTAFPVFEQPDLKARFSLNLTVPTGWQALSNGALLSREESASQSQLRFAETRPISTYLFAFAAGDLLVESAERDGRTLTMFHRETDADSLQRNRDAIFDLHADALHWMEEYTGIAYPFDKFDFFAIPAFQFGGMEHPGAIWYRAESLFLDPTATRAQELGRASLIAHETAHMWFGNLVTMRWFNDVWMKEVFANFMAAKIAGPSFPDLDLPLRFFQAHHPAAYAVDRTAGANPIRQPLVNLRNAGSLYGAIIYQKAPIVMQQLEILLGEDVLREGLQQYLLQHSFDNATWPDLIKVLDGLSPLDLATWSQVWVNEPGRPTIEARWTGNGIRVTQTDDWSGRSLLWHQSVVLAVGLDGVVSEHTVQLDGPEALVPFDAEPDFILPGARGIAYGRFVLDEHSREALLAAVHGLDEPLHRAVTWQTLWEEVLDGSLAATSFVQSIVQAIETEQDELVTQQVLGLLRSAWWRYLPHSERLAMTDTVESALWQALERTEGAGRKGAYFSTIVDVTLSDAGITRLYAIWRGDESHEQVPIEGLPLEEQQFINLAEALALRGIPEAPQILDEQMQRINNADRRARFSFMQAALSAEAGDREALFHSFVELDNRRRESWVLDAVRAIHHPLRADETRHLLRPGLDLLEEIQQTGDIFFPLRWLNAMLSGHSSAEAADVLRQYLDQRPDLPGHLREKVLQAADDLFRASG